MPWELAGGNQNKCAVFEVIRFSSANGIILSNLVSVKIESLLHPKLIASTGHGEERAKELPVSRMIK